MHLRPSRAVPDGRPEVPEGIRNRESGGRGKSSECTLTIQDNSSISDVCELKQKAESKFTCLVTRSERGTTVKMLGCAKALQHPAGRGRALWPASDTGAVLGDEPRRMTYGVCTDPQSLMSELNWMM